jgi:hypothetical protein
LFAAVISVIIHYPGTNRQNASDIDTFSAKIKRGTQMARKSRNRSGASRAQGPQAATRYDWLPGGHRPPPAGSEGSLQDRAGGRPTLLEFDADLRCLAPSYAATDNGLGVEYEIEGVRNPDRAWHFEAGA